MRHLLELFLFFILLMGLTDGYIYRSYIRHWKRKWMRCIYALPAILLLVAMLYVFATFEPTQEAMGRFCVFMAIYLCFYVPKTIFTILMLLFKFIVRKTNRHFKENHIALAIAIYAMGYLIFGATEGLQHFKVKEVVIHSEDLPEAFDGYRIVQISDIHAGSWNGDTRPMQKAVKLINEQEADLIVFTGDLVNNVANELDEFMPVLSKLEAPDGVYSILGNHDYSMYIQWEKEEDRLNDLDSLKSKQAEMGWKLLTNNHVKLYQGKDSIALIGVENSGRPPFPDLAQLPEAMKGTEGMFKILLSHDPTHWRREVLPDTDIQLTLAGHTHGMQTRIFGFSPARFIFPEHSGLYKEKGQMLYVNIGLGHLMYPMRLGAWPEITLLTLKKKK